MTVCKQTTENRRWNSTAIIPNERAFVERAPRGNRVRGAACKGGGRSAWRGWAMSIEEFHNLLGTLTSSDNAARQQAEATYNSTKESQPVTVLTFLAQTIQCPDDNLRAFAAVLFRRSCPELWRNPAVDAATKTTIKQLLIETIRQVCVCCPRAPWPHASPLHSVWRRSCSSECPRNAPAPA